MAWPQKVGYPEVGGPVVIGRVQDSWNIKTVVVGPHRRKCRTKNG